MALTAGRTGAALALGLLLLAPALRAQDSVIVIDPDAPPVDTLMRGGPPPEVVAELIAFYNDSATTRTVGDDVRVTVKVTARGSSPVPGRVTLAFGAVRRTLTLAGGSAEVVLDRPARATTLTVSYTGSPRVEARRTSAVVG